MFENTLLHHEMFRFLSKTHMGLCPTGFQNKDYSLAPTTGHMDLMFGWKVANTLKAVKGLILIKIKSRAIPP